MQGHLDANGNPIMVPVRVIRNDGRDGQLPIGSVIYVPIGSAISLAREGIVRRLRRENREQSTRLPSEHAVTT